jgi:branched-chain amino acid aminotransferase
MVKNYTILSPVGPYYPEGFAPVKLFADPHHVRAWPGGSGGSKIGANYGPTIRPAVNAAERGHTQVLWLFRHSDDPLEAEVTEVGTMNLFVLWKNEQGERELVTAPLDDTVLPGVTRKSVIELAQEWGECKVSERKYTIGELTKALDEGRVEEAFGSGTAAVVSPVEQIEFLEKLYKVPLGPNDEKDKGAGPFARKIWDELTSIQYGLKEHEWSVVVD